MKAHARLWTIPFTLIMTALIFIVPACLGGNTDSWDSSSSSDEKASLFAGESSFSVPIIIITDTKRSFILGIDSEDTNEGYFEFTPTITGVYTISLTNTTRNLSWWWWDNGYNVENECDKSDLAVDEVCDIEVETNITRIFVVRNYGDEDAKFDLLISTP